MHNIVLLRKLTAEQLKGVIKNDPLMHRNNIWSAKAVETWKGLDIEDDLINELLFSCAVQFEKEGKHAITSDYLRMLDRRLHTHFAREHAIRIGSFDLLCNPDENLAWHDFARTGSHALSKGDLKSAWNCYDHVHKDAGETLSNLIANWTTDSSEFKNAKQAVRAATLGIKTILKRSLREGEFDLVERCLDSLKRNLTQPEIRTLRYHLVLLFIEIPQLRSNDSVCETIKRYANDSEKRACLNALAARGEKNLFAELARLWNVRVTERHLKRLLGHYWYTQPNGGDAFMRVEILRELTEHSDRYTPMLDRALASAREHAITCGEIKRAHELGEEIGQPVTLNEYTHFLRMYGNDPRYTNYVAFAIERVIALVGAKSEPTDVNANFIAEHISGYIRIT